MSYLGDADLGAGTNVGAGTITANFDGTAKHRTTIGERVFLGVDTMLRAPVTIGDDARTGAGAVVTKDVPAGKLAVGMPARIREPRAPKPGPTGRTGAGDDAALVEHPRHHPADAARRASSSPARSPSSRSAAAASSSSSTRAARAPGASGACSTSRAGSSPSRSSA